MNIVKYGKWEIAVDVEKTREYYKSYVLNESQANRSFAEYCKVMSVEERAFFDSFGITPECCEIEHVGVNKKNEFPCGGYYLICGRYLSYPKEELLTVDDLIEKDFEDEFAATKPYFGINSTSTIGYLSSIKKIPTFAGNSEEINLYYIWKRFQKVKHKTKILMVLCDGATTGSRDSLKRIIKQIEDDGIIVIGIGIMCSEVASLYPRHKLFNSAEELDRDLPQYLIDTLSEYAV